MTLRVQLELVDAEADAQGPQAGLLLLLFGSMLLLARGRTGRDERAREHEAVLHEAEEAFGRRVGRERFRARVRAVELVDEVPGEAAVDPELAVCDFSPDEFLAILGRSAGRLVDSGCQCPTYESRGSRRADGDELDAFRVDAGRVVGQRVSVLVALREEFAFEPRRQRADPHRRHLAPSLVGQSRDSASLARWI